MFSEEKKKSITTETNYDTHMAHMTQTSHRNHAFYERYEIWLLRAVIIHRLNQAHSENCWVVLTQIWVKYGQTQMLG